MRVVEKIIAGSRFHVAEAPQRRRFYKRAIPIACIHALVLFLALEFGIALPYQIGYSVCTGLALRRYLCHAARTDTFLYSPFEDLFLFGMIFYVLPISIIFILLSHMPIDPLLVIQLKNAWPKDWLVRFLYSNHRIVLTPLMRELDASLFCLTYLIYFTWCAAIPAVMASGSFSKYWRNLIAREGSPHQWLFIILAMANVFFGTQFVYLQSNPPVHLSEFSDILRQNDIGKKVLAFSFGPLVAIQLVGTGLIGYLTYFLKKPRVSDDKPDDEK